MSHHTNRYKAGAYEHDEVFADAGDAVCTSSMDCTNKVQTPRSPLDMPLSRSNMIDKDFSSEESIPKVTSHLTVSYVCVPFICVNLDKVRC